MLNLNNKKLILASKSPRRASLLKEMDLDFDIEVREVDESYPEDLSSNDVAEYIAHKKALAFDNLNENQIAIFSDTVVVNENKVLGKPKDYDEAFRMLKEMSGKSHFVYSAVVLKSNSLIVSFTDATKVYFSEMSDDVIDYYINQKKPFDKAGSYGIQEWIGMTMIEKIEGSYFTVMGLPTEKLYKKLSKFINS